MLSVGFSYSACVVDSHIRRTRSITMSEFKGNSVTWFEIPVSDVQRAVGFYESMLDTKLIPFGDACNYYVFPAGQGEVGGGLVKRPTAQPAAQGTMVFLNADGKLDASMKRAKELGPEI